MSASVSLSLSPELVVCARCSCVMLSPGFLIPSPLHCPTAPPQGCGNPQRPVDADSLMRWPQCTLCPWRWLGCGQAGGGAARGPVSVCARWRSMLRSGTCPPILPHVLSPPSKAHGCVFFFLFFLAFSSVFSLALPLSFLLSLSFSVFFFFVFLPENQSEERGRVKRESARKAGTNHPACTFVSPACRLSSLPFPNQSACLLLTQNHTLPPSHWWAAGPAGAMLAVAPLWHEGCLREGGFGLLDSL